MSEIIDKSVLREQFTERMAQMYRLRFQAYSERVEIVKLINHYSIRQGMRSSLT